MFVKNSNQEIHNEMIKRFDRPKELSEPFIAKYLESLGYEIVPQEKKEHAKTPDLKDIEDHKDFCDIICIDPEGNKKYVEVKHHIEQEHWTGIKDFPYPKILIDAYEPYQRRKHFVDYYYILNTDMTACAVVDVKKVDPKLLEKFWTKPAHLPYGKFCVRISKHHESITFIKMGE